MREEVKESITKEDQQEESMPAPAAPDPSPAKNRSILRWLLDAKIFNKHTGKFVILLVLLLWITNPSMIPFLPLGAKERLTGYAEWLLGDVKTIYEVLPISRVKIIQIAVMILFLCLIAEIAKNSCSGARSLTNCAHYASK